MKILLYGVPDGAIVRIAVRYGFRVTGSLDEEVGTSDILVPIRSVRSSAGLLSLYDTLIVREAEIDAVVVCGTGNDEIESTIRYGASPGKLFSLCADADLETLEYELGRIVESLAGLLCAHETS